MSTLSARGIAPVLALLQRPHSSTTMLPRCLIIVQKSTEGGLTNGLAKHDAHLPERTRHHGSSSSGTKYLLHQGKVAAAAEGRGPIRVAASLSQTQGTQHARVAKHTHSHTHACLDGSCGMAKSYVRAPAAATPHSARRKTICPPIAAATAPSVALFWVTGWLAAVHAALLQGSRLVSRFQKQSQNKDVGWGLPTPTRRRRRRRPLAPTCPPVSSAVHWGGCTPGGCACSPVAGPPPR